MMHDAFGPLNPIVILLAFLVSAGIAGSWGPQAAFRWALIPAFVLFPRDLEIVFQGLPDLTVRRAATLGMLLGTAIRGSHMSLIPRWCWFDVLPVAVTLSFSISSGLNSTFRGLYTEMLDLSLDWLIPYLIARALLKDREAIRGALISIAICTSILATLAIVESLFGLRISRLWNRLGAGIRGRPSWQRYGFTRSFVHFTTPVSLGAYFATVAPLMILWRRIDPRRRRFANLALVLCVGGCLAAGSRGPWFAMAAVTLIFPLLARNVRVFLTTSAVLLLVAGPFIATELNERIEYTQQQLDETGNVDSGHYRIALWMIYGNQIGAAGWFGNKSIIGAEYEKASSIDNSYIYLLLVGGWLGGGLFIWMVFARLGSGIRAIARANVGRTAMTATVASFAACILCMLNTWFNPCFSYLFWWTGALAINYARIDARENRARRAERKRRSRTDPPAQPGLVPQRT